jgi:hypothetical protein
MNLAGNHVGVDGYGAFVEGNWKQLNYLWICDAYQICFDEPIWVLPLFITESSIVKVELKAKNEDIRKNVNSVFHKKVKKKKKMPMKEV